MLKIKVIVGGYAGSLEEQVNRWLADHRTSDIVNIQYQLAGNHSVCITYRDGT